ncbi:hypothetical protein Bhyg_09052, partial [Pseudolycoriella hygida]
MERYSVKTNNASSPNRSNKKDLRQSRIGSSSSMDSTNSSSMYRKSYPNSDINASFSSSVAGSIQCSECKARIDVLTALPTTDVSYVVYSPINTVN